MKIKLKSGKEVVLNDLTVDERDELLDSVRCSNYHQLERQVQAQFKAVRIPQTEYYRLNKEQVKKVYELLRKGAK